MLFMGEGFTVHATSRTTGGGFLIAEITSRPGGGPVHMHAHEAAEQYMCLDGRITVMTGEGTTELGPLQRTTSAPWRPTTYPNLGDSRGGMLGRLRRRVYMRRSCARCASPWTTPRRPCRRSPASRATWPWRPPSDTG